MTTQKIFGIVLILASTCKLFAAEEPNLCEKLNLSSTQIAAATVYYEKSFEPKLPVFEKVYKQFLVEKEKSNTILAKKEQIIADINHILGITEPDTKMQHDIMTEILGAFSTAKPTFYLVKQATTKDFLRAGGQLPNFTYDKATDTATYKVEFKATSKTGPIKDFELAIPVASNEEFEKTIGIVFKILLEEMHGSGNFGVAIHEVVEMSLLMQVKPQDPYWRWFSDGFADAITYELLKRHVSEESAEEFAAGNDVNNYKDLEKEINLQYWMSAKYCVLPFGRPVDYEKKLTLARYAYAAVEAQRLIENHSIDCVRKILDEVCTGKSRTSHDLMQAIKNVTGENMQERLGRYQTFGTREEGMPKYTIPFNAASKKKDYEQMLINLLRVMELQDTQFLPNNLQSWKNAAWLLFKMGHEEAADEAMQNCISLFEESPIPQGREAAMERFIIYALDCKKPQKAQTAAEELLKTRPNHVPSLAVQMLLHVESGELSEAKTIAKKIHSLAKTEKDKQSLTYRAASQILAIDPNQQRLDK